jgi:hypothetical protein
MQTNGIAPRNANDNGSARRNVVTFPPIKAERTHPVGTYSGSCMRCRHAFTVKLSTPAIEVKCPECWHYTDISTFSTPTRLVM